jgi:hypothetical protein
MNSPDENPLLQEILADEKLSAFRRASLDHALAEMRQARQRRRTVRVAGLALLPLALVALFAWYDSLPESSELRPDGTERGVHAASGSDTGDSPERISTQDSEGVLKQAEARAPSEVQTITDEELFALFPNRAMALIGPPGRQQLVFLDTVVQN